MCFHLFLSQKLSHIKKHKNALERSRYHEKLTMMSQQKQNSNNIRTSNIPCLSQGIGGVIAALLLGTIVCGGASFNAPIQKPVPTIVAPISTGPNAPKPLLVTMELTAVYKQNYFSINGKVPNEAIRISIENELRSTFGDGHYANNLVVDDQVKAPKWLDKLSGFFSFFKLPGAELSTNGDTLTLSGTAVSLKEPLIEFLGSEVKIKALDVASNVKSANASALSALDNLSVNSDVQSILNALNMQIINFASGSSKVPEQNQEILKKAAALLLNKNEKFEVSGHADNTGDEVLNVKLSTQRAQSVREFLLKQQVPEDIVVAKGYGSSMPIASNDTETGRLKNRRIEFRITR